jgi:hypothetical protein
MKLFNILVVFAFCVLAAANGRSESNDETVKEFALFAEKYPAPGGHGIGLSGKKTDEAYIIAEKILVKAKEPEWAKRYSMAVLYSMEILQAQPEKKSVNLVTHFVDDPKASFRGSSRRTLAKLAPFDVEAGEVLLKKLNQVIRDIESQGYKAFESDMTYPLIVGLLRSGDPVKRKLALEKLAEIESIAKNDPKFIEAIRLLRQTLASEQLPTNLPEVILESNVSEPAIKTPEPTPVVSTLPEEKSSPWLLIVASIVIAIAGAGLFWLLKKPSFS